MCIRDSIEVDDINFRNPLYGTENFVFTMSSNDKVKYKKKVYRNDADVYKRQELNHMRFQISDQLKHYIQMAYIQLFLSQYIQKM